MRFRNTVASAAIVGGLAAGAMGLSAATASAEGSPPPDPPAAASPSTPQAWDQGRQHWGVWINGIVVPTY
ncbi:hypothetical protein [Mycolicibacterium mengxianglii]|uniref:hypothetical protein n=1 Tax=Mycolicibacterium mengxianglii TaxID=2736649 RepID=UPI0018D1445F|nr:hypothetical protein [Mycolicibacterium mengxianglii]